MKIRVVLHKELPEARRDAWNRPFLSAFRGSTALLTLIWDSWPAGPCDNKLLFKPLSLWHFVMAALAY